MRPTTRTRVFIDPSDMLDAYQAVLHGPGDTTPGYIADVLNHAQASADEMDGEWHAAEYKFSDTCRPPSDAVSLVLDTYVDPANSSSGVVLSGWTGTHHTSVVVATNEKILETARIVMANMHMIFPGEHPELWRSVPRFVPGDDINIDMLIAQHRRVDLRVKPYHNIEQARIIANLEQATTKAMRLATKAYWGSTPHTGGSK